MRAECIELARWLAARERDLDEAVDLGTTALLLGDDIELRREVSAWLESLGDAARAAGVLRPIASRTDVDPSDVAYVLVRAGVLKSRAGAAGAAAAAFETALTVDPDDALPAELLGSLAAWQPGAVSPEAAAAAYLEAARRRRGEGRESAEYEDLWRALATNPTGEAAAAVAASALERDGREEAADQVWCACARALMPHDEERAKRIHAQRRARAQDAGKPVRALAAALDQGIDAALDGADGKAFDGLLLDAGLPDAVAARLDARAEAAGLASERASYKAELGRLSAGPLADPERAVSAFAAALAADASCEPARIGLRSLLPELRPDGSAPEDERVDLLQAILGSLESERDEAARYASLMSRLGQTVRRGLTARSSDEPHSRGDTARAWVRASLARDVRQQGLWLERVAEHTVSALRATLLSAAAERLLASGDKGGGRRLAEKACVADARCAPAVALLADAVLGQEDAAAAGALERAITFVGPRITWCVALSNVLFALGETDFGIAYAQRCTSLRPGDLTAVETLLDRLLLAGDAANTANTLGSLLAGPHPIADLASPFANALSKLARADANRAVVVARRALDVFGPKLAILREAMLEAAGRAGDGAFAAAISERWASCAGDAAERKALFAGLADHYERADDFANEARVVARAFRERLGGPEIERHLARLGQLSLSSDPLVWRMTADVERWAGLGETEAAAQAARALGGALWDLADDRVGALAAWERAARLSGAGGHATLALDLIAFASAPFAFDYLGRRIEAEPDDRAAAAIAAEAARAALSIDQPLAGLELASKGLARCPSWPEGLEVAELCAQQGNALPELSALYDAVAARTMGHFGQRAAHYRAARFFERRGDASLALGHAARAFAALPSEGSTFQLLRRAARRAADPTDAVRVLEVAASAAKDPSVRAAWLVRAAELLGERPERAKQSVDALLHATVLSPSADIANRLGGAVRRLLRSEPDERDSLELRIAGATRTVEGGLRGPDGARTALTLAAVFLESFADQDKGLDLVEKAYALDADVPEFAEIARFEELLSRAPSSAGRVSAMLADWPGKEVSGEPPSVLLLQRLAVRCNLAPSGDDRTDAASIAAQDVDAEGAESGMDPASVGDNSSPIGRADRWTEVAERRQARGEREGAVRALAEACRLDPEALGRWSLLERTAEAAGDVEARALALEQIWTRVGPDGRIAVGRRLALALEARGPQAAAEEAWRVVLALDPSDDEADQRIEAMVVEGGRYAELAEHLAQRAERLLGDPSRSETLRAVRLRRAVILEQRLGRMEEAKAELELLLSESPDHPGALRFLADLVERNGDPARASGLWARAAEAELDPLDLEDIHLRAGRAAFEAGDFSTAVEHAGHILGLRPTSKPGLELRRDAARAIGSESELGDALEAMAEVEADRIVQSDQWVEAALSAARSGNLDRALVRASRAADAAPHRATPQLLARGLEYRIRGAGSLELARRTLDDLARITEPIGADDVALRAFLVAEAMDVVHGITVAIRELVAAQKLAGEHPLIALGLAERLAQKGDAAGAAAHYRVALSGPLLGLRSPAAIALAAADCAARANLQGDALRFLSVADRYEETRGPARARRARMEQGPSTLVPEEPQGLVPSDSGLTQDAPLADGLALPQANRLSGLSLWRGDSALVAEARFGDETKEGTREGGKPSTPSLGMSPDPSRDLVRVKRQRAMLQPGHAGCLEDLRDAAAGDGDDVYALAIEHVLRAFHPQDERLLPPPLEQQPEQPGLFALLTRPSGESAGEILKLLWEGGAQLFARDAASYAVTGVERVVPGSTSPLARFYELAIRALDAPRIPLFVSKTGGDQVAAHVALLLPPSVILSGPVREDTPALRFELGRGMSAALAQNVLRLGLPADEGRSVLEALRAAFGPPEYGPQVRGRAAQLAQAFWQLIPARMQRRFAQLLVEAPLPEYSDLVERAYQSGRRVGLFLCGDFSFAAGVLLAETAGIMELPTLAELPALCRDVPMLVDLLELAISPEYAHARWHTDGAVARGAYTPGRFSLY